MLIADWTNIVNAISGIAMVVITVLLTILGWYQLNKIRQSNNMQALEALYNNFISDALMEKRKSLALYIRNFQFNDKVGFDALKEYLDKETLANTIGDKVAEIKNVFEHVIFLFEKIGYYSLYKKIYSVADVFELFFYEIQNYWILVDSIGYIKYLRENRFDGKISYYTSFEDLYVKMIPLDFLSDDVSCNISNRMKRKYLRMSVSKIRLDPKCIELRNRLENRDRIVQFLKEEF